MELDEILTPEESANREVEKLMIQYSIEDIRRNTEDYIKVCNNNKGTNCISCNSQMRSSCEYLMMYRAIIKKEIKLL